MRRRVLVFDTSILCCLLKVRGKETAGSHPERWDHKRVSDMIAAAGKATFVLPLASIIETGNHISQAPDERYEAAKRLCEIIERAAKATSPWAAFAEQADLWRPERLSRLARDWPDLAKSGLSIGDATIKEVADYYGKAGYEVEIVTADKQLRAYQPTRPARQPRRRGG